MSTKAYQALCAEHEADQQLRERIADARVAEAETPEVGPEIVAVAPVLTVMEQFQKAIISCRNMDDAIKISPAILAEVLELKVPIPHYFFDSVRAICADCGWTARMTWSEFGLEIGQAARRARREELLAQVKS